MSAASPPLPGPAGPAGVTARITRPTQADVSVLAAVRDYPCVSVLVNTRPAARMMVDDRARLDALIKQVETRLRLEGFDRADKITERLDFAAAVVREAPTDRALALYASSSMIEYRHLAVPVEERQIIDPTFATRDLVRSLQESPDYALLVLDSDSARLFRCRAGVMQERVDHAFPVLRDTDAPSARRRRSGRRRGTRTDRPDNRAREQARAFLRRVDQALNAEVSTAPLPVIVMAGDKVLSDFLAVSAGSGNLIAFARNAGGRLDFRRLDRQVRPLLADHLADLEAAARETMDARMPGYGVLTGLPTCWYAAQFEQPELLLVEESFAVPARVSRDGTLVHPLSTAERELPGVIDDVVDDLVELVIARGGQVRFVPDGSLASSERVALRVALTTPGRRRRG